MKNIAITPDLKLINTELSDALLIFQNALSSSKSLLRAFELARQNRGKSRGGTTDQEQDILRAMLVMACAGLDAGLKQVIKDGLPLLVRVNVGAQTGLETFVERQVRGEETDFGTNTKYLAKVLSSSSPYARVINSYITALTGDSLQSADQLFKATTALGLDPNALNLDKKLLRPIFDARNQIIHELDIDLDGARRIRIIRGLNDMVEWTDRVLELTKRIIEAVDKIMPPLNRRMHRTRFPGR
ncbi:MAG: hypothetical protein PHU23_11375 [Dehalococcoidales bacterium]|nr:hypothetical protein [Dehalococcoidales bacterium]